ncbi:aldose 1-epimerase [Bosea sp. F3-2]|uniref:aldose epimerase family protein n=1 Tax=Bosea sp. F3-2 TaxID=2599640 RepID=UPI0011EF8057|nr:aldose 1-epimerase [Bosea sp. F3-2]QEL22957.1 aldose 1-epimerase [Bosea sp. F3-2]
MVDATTSPLRSAEASPHVHALVAGRMHASVRPLDGGRLASLWREEPGSGRTDVLVPMPETGFDPLNWPKAGTYPLVPFSNRIRGAAFRFGETRVELASHPAAAPHALHGFCQMRPWTMTRHSEAQVEMHYRHDPENTPDAWPWEFEAIQRITLDATGVTHEIGVESRAASPMPIGLGLHPYFAVSQGDRIRFAADALWEADADGCGRELRTLTGSARVHDSRHGEEEVTAYHADWGGTASIDRRDGTRVVIEADAPLDHLVFHVPAGGGYLCLEPVSHVADAFNLAAAGQAGTGARVLRPGEAISAIMRIRLA